MFALSRESSSLAEIAEVFIRSLANSSKVQYSRLINLSSSSHAGNPGSNLGKPGTISELAKNNSSFTIPGKLHIKCLAQLA